MQRVLTPGPVILKIYSDATTSPGSLLTTSINTVTVPEEGVFTEVGFSFDETVLLVADTIYWAVLEPSAGGAFDTGAYVFLKASSVLLPDQTYSRGRLYDFTSGSWQETITWDVLYSSDLCFKQYSSPLITTTLILIS